MTAQPSSASGSRAALLRALEDVDLTPRVRRLRDAYFAAMPEICTERPRLLTEYHVAHRLLTGQPISALEKARAYRFVLENRSAEPWPLEARDSQRRPFAVQARSLFAGSTTSRFKGVVIYPELMGLTLWPELESISTRSSNPCYLDEQDAELLNLEVFPRWLDTSVLELARTATHGDAPAPDLELLQHMVFFLASKPSGISHTIPDFRGAIELGLGRLIRQAEERGAQAEDDERRLFYAAMGEGLRGIVAFSHRLARAADRQAWQQQDPVVQAELRELARIHRQVPEHPATSLREGMTTLWVCWIALNLENVNIALSPGRLDQLLHGLYQRDLAAGRITLERAVELFCCLWLKIGDHVPAIPEAGEQLLGGAGSNQAITIGGVDARGEDAVNDLSYVILRACELMKLRDPNLNARFMPGVSAMAYLDRLCLANLRTGATPALHNDAAVIPQLTARGASLEHARDYGVVGCVEPCLSGRQYGHHGALLFNLASVLELALFDGCHRHTGLGRRIGPATGDPRSFTSFDQLWDAFAIQLAWLAGRAVAVNDALGRVHQAYLPTPILSALFSGPMDCGLDLARGGAEVNSSGVAVVATPDVADSLCAVKHVLERGQVGFRELIDALQAELQGYETLAAVLERAPAYGNEEPAAASMIHAVMELVHDTFAAHRSYRGGDYRVGYWSMTNHAAFGRLMGALPNGHLRGGSFASGITPVSGRAVQLTRALNSVAALPWRRVANGVAFNVRLAPDPGGADAQERAQRRMAALVAGYFEPRGDRPGGPEIQFNIADARVLRDAMAHPHRHPELLVRVSGYTAYFKDLNPDMQREILQRTEYLLASGTDLSSGPLEL